MPVGAVESNEAMILLLKNLLFTAIVPGMVAVYTPYSLTRGREPATGAILLAALVVMAIGIAIYVWCVWNFATFGRGTPAPIDAPKRLVARGPYRYSRNPMYVGILGVVLGWALLYRSPLVVGYALALWLGFHLVVMLYEEPHLRRVFGPEYDDYRATVGRWLPGIGRSGRRRG